MKQEILVIQVENLSFIQGENLSFLSLQISVCL